MGLFDKLKDAVKGTKQIHFPTADEARKAQREAEKRQFREELDEDVRLAKRQAFKEQAIAEGVKSAKAQAHRQYGMSKIDKVNEFVSGISDLGDFLGGKKTSASRPKNIYATKGRVQQPRYYLDQNTGNLIPVGGVRRTTPYHQPQHVVQPKRKKNPFDFDSDDLFGDMGNLL